MLPLRDNIPTDRFPILTVVLIVLNVAIFGWQFLQPADQASTPALVQAGVSEQDQVAIEYGAIPYRLTHPGSECGVARGADILCEGTAEYRAAVDSNGLAPLDEAPWWLTVLTSMFLHGSLLHIAGNMLFLWVFGNNIEDSMGRPKFLAFYLMSGIVAVYAQTLLDPDATVPTIGASGAVAGVLGGYILLHPRARVLTLVFIVFFVTFIEIPAMIMLGVWFALQLLPAVGQVAAPEATADGGVAYLAHLGGFVFGLATIKLFADRRRVAQPESKYPVY